MPLLSHPDRFQVTSAEINGDLWTIGWKIPRNEAGEQVKDGFCSEFDFPAAAFSGAFIFPGGG